MRLSELDLNKQYTYADYYQWQFDERVELIEGKVYEMMPGPNRAHQGIVMFISNKFYNYLVDGKCKVYVAPFDVRLPKKGIDDRSIFTVLQPDICVVCDASKLDRRGCIGAPDVVVEVLSPGNNAKELKKKFDIYEEFGVREYWVVSPQDQMVLIYTLVEGKFQPSKMMAPGDIATSTVFPDFALDLTEVFRDIESD